LVFALYPSEYQNNITVLKKTCADLTKNNSEGRVYEPIVGHYLKNKSFTSVEQPNPGPTEYSNIITFVNDGEETSLYSERMTHHMFNEKYMLILKQVIYERSDANSEKNVYGICGYRDASIDEHYGNESDNKLMDNISTLTLIKEE